MRRSLAVLAAALLLALLPAPPTHAATSRPGGVLLLGESITWQTCSGSGQRFPPIAPRVLRERDGGCHGWSGATTADMNYQIQGGRFLSNGDGQPYPTSPAGDSATCGAWVKPSTGPVSSPSASAPQKPDAPAAPDL